MQEKTRKKLQLIVEKADLMADWGFAEHLRDKGLSLHISWSADRPEGQEVQTISRVLPTQEQFTNTHALLRFFTQANEGIRLFRNDWIEPRQHYQIPDWLTDPDLSTNWRLHYEDYQLFINKYLLGVNPGSYVTVDGVKVTRGMIFEAFGYGELIHSTERPRLLLDRIRTTIMGATAFDFEHAAILTNIMIVIQRMSQVTKLELAGEPVPPVPQR